MADDGDSAGVDDLLGGKRAFLRVGLVVLADDHDLVDLVAELDATGGIDFLGGELGAELVVLAQVRDAAGQRRDVADLELGFLRSRCSGSRLGGLGLGRFFFLAACGKRDRGGNRQRHERNGASIHDLFSSMSVGRTMIGSGKFAR